MSHYHATQKICMTNKACNVEDDVESRTQHPLVIGFTLAHGHTWLVL